MNSAPDLLAQYKSSSGSLAVARTLRFLKEGSLCLLETDKDGCFAVMPKSLLEKKATEAFESVFSRKNDVALGKVKSQAKKLCKKMNLEGLAQSIGKSAGTALNMFFTVKTHKIDSLFRVIVSERNT